MMKLALVVCTLRVFSAMVWPIPAYATPNSAASSTMSTAPRGPLLIRIPNARPSSSTNVELARPRTKSAASRASTIEVRRIGATSSLSK